MESTRARHGLDPWTGGAMVQGTSDVGSELETSGPAPHSAPQACQHPRNDQGPPAAAIPLSAAGKELARMLALADIQVNETTMAIEIRPRDIDARLELDMSPSRSCSIRASRRRRKPMPPADHPIRIWRVFRATNGRRYSSGCRPRTSSTKCDRAPARIQAGFALPRNRVGSA